MTFIKQLLIFCCFNARPLSFPSEALKLAEANDFQLAGYKIEADQEATRPPRVIRVGVVQNVIVQPTHEDVTVQRDALHQRMTSIIGAASLAGVNVLCFQEAWSNMT